MKKLFLFSFIFFLPLSFALFAEAAEESSVEDGTTVRQAHRTEDDIILLPHLYTYLEQTVAEQKQVITKEEIEELHAASLPEILQSAGIQNLNYGPYGTVSTPSIRGFTGSTVKVVIDGVCVNSAMNGTYDFTSISPESIEKIEIIRGGFTEDVSGSGAVGGVIYITTKKQSLGKNLCFDISTKTYFSPYFPFDTEQASVSYDGQLGESTFLKSDLNGTFAKNAFSFLAYNNKTKYRENSSVIDGSTNTKLTHFFGSGNFWYVGENFYGGYKNIAGVENSATPGIQQDYNNSLSCGVSLPSLGQCVKINSDLVYLSNNEFYDASNESSKHYLNTVTSTTTADLYKFSKFKQSLGLTLSVANINSTDDGQHTLPSGTLSETSRYFLNSIFSFSLPLAFTFSGENIAFVPKAGVNADFKKVSLSLSAYRMILFPDLNQLYWGESATASGNPDLKNEDGYGAELSCKVDCFLPFTLSIYTNYYFNKIKWASVSGKWQPANIASAFYAGCDFSFEKKFFECLTVSFNWEYLYNMLLAEGMTYGKMIMYTPDNVGSLSLSYNKNNLSISCDAQYVGKRYISNMNISYLKPYVLLNATASYKIKISSSAGGKQKYLEPYLKTENLLNVDYESVPGYPLPGVSLKVGVRGKF